MLVVMCTLSDFVGRPCPLTMAKTGYQGSRPGCDEMGERNTEK